MSDETRDAVQDEQETQGQAGLDHRTPDQEVPDRETPDQETSSPPESAREESAREASDRSEAPQPESDVQAVAGGSSGEAKSRTGFKRRLAGRVKSNKMMKTVVVQVVRYYRHPVYKKYVRNRISYKAHDEENTCRVGDRVEIIECRPMSKEKRWKVARVLERAVID